MASITGEVYFDENLDGQRQDSEAVLADVPVFLDTNTNGRLDPTEVSTRTDVGGVYSFPQVGEGTYEVRILPPRGTVQTSPARSYAAEEIVIEVNDELQRATQLVAIDDNGQVTELGAPSLSRIDGIAQLGDGSLVIMDSRQNQIFRVDPSTGERATIGTAEQDITGGLAYDRVDNSVYTIVKGFADTSARALARVDINSGRVEQLGEPLPGIRTVADIAFDAANRRVVGFDDSSDQFFSFSLNGGGQTLGQVDTPLDSSSLALEVSQALAGQPTIARLFDSDARDLQTSVLVDIETGVVQPGTPISRSTKIAALTKPGFGPVATTLELTEFEIATGVDFTVDEDVLGFQLLPSAPAGGAAALGQRALTVVGGAIDEDFVELSLNRRPNSSITFNLELQRDGVGPLGASLSTQTVTFTPDEGNWNRVERIRIARDSVDPVSFVTPTFLTVRVDGAVSDPQWSSLPAQSLPVRVLPPLDEIDPGQPVINELLVSSWLSFATEEEQFIELRGLPNDTLPVGTYFVVANEEFAGFGKFGEIETIIDLSGQQFGSNGMLVILPNNSPHLVDSGARVLRSTSNGLEGLPGGIFSSRNDISFGDNGLGDNNSEASYFLIQSDSAPVLGEDLDAQDDGVIDADGAGASWEIYDSVAIHDFGINQDITLASIAFFDRIFQGVNASVDFSPSGQTLVFTEGVGYVARIGDSIGSEADDWVGGEVETVSSSFNADLDDSTLLEFHDEELSDKRFFDRALDHIGKSNFVGGVRGTLLLSPSAGEIAAGTDPNLRLPAEGITVIADTNGNGVRDDIVHVVEPNDVVPDFDPLNPQPVADEVPLTQFFPGVAISEIIVNSLMRDDIVSERQTSGTQQLGNRIFSRGVSWFTDSARLRFDFDRPIKSATIDVLNTRTFGTDVVYGRLVAYNAAGEILDTAISAPVRLGSRTTMSISEPGEQIAFIEAYFDDTLGGSTIFGAFDTLTYVQSEAAAVTDQNGFFEISPLRAGNYQLRLQESIESANLLSGTVEEFEVVTTENEFFEDLYPLRLNTLPTATDKTVVLNEDLSAGESITTFSAQDADNDGLTYEIASSTLADLQLVDLGGQEIDIRLGANTVLDFETKQEEVIILRVTDLAGSSTTARIDVTVQDVNEAPVARLNEILVTEDAQVGDAVGQLVAEDPDVQASPAQEVSFLELGGDAGDFFNIDPESGIITLIQPIDFEAAETLTLQVQVSDNFQPDTDPNGPTAGQTQGVAIINQVIRILDENDTPGLDATPVNVPESRTGELFDLNELVIDPDTDQSYQFLLIEPANAEFEINSEGKVILAEGSSLDHETADRIELLINVSDNGSPSKNSTGTVVINVTDVNEPARIVASGGTLENISLIGFVGENLTAGQAGSVVQFAPDADSPRVGSLSLVDPEGQSDQVGFELANDDPVSDLFDFDSATGVLSVAADVTLDFETQNSYLVPFDIGDTTGGAPSTRQFIEVRVVNENEPPTITNDLFLVSERPRDLDLVSQIQINDPERSDQSPTVDQYEVQIVALETDDTANDVANFFQIAEINGEFFLQVRDGINFSDPSVTAFWDADTESPQDLRIRLQVTEVDPETGEPDTLKQTATTIPLRLNNVNEPPVIQLDTLANTGLVSPINIEAGQQLEITIPSTVAVDPEGLLIDPSDENQAKLLVRVFQRAQPNGNGPNEGTLPNWIRFDDDTRQLTVDTTLEQAGSSIDLTLRVLEFFPSESSGEFLSDNFNFFD